MQNNKVVLRQAQQAINKVVSDMRQKQTDAKYGEMILAINSAIGPLLAPYLNQIVKNASLSREETARTINEAVGEIKVGIRDALSNLKLDSIVHDIKIPEIQIPNIPDVKVNIDTAGIQEAVKQAVSNIRIDAPAVHVPPIQMPERMMVDMDRVDKMHPLPAMLVDLKGQPVSFGQGGSKMDFFTVKGFGQSAFAELMNADNQVRVAGTFTASAAASTYVIAGNSEGVVYNTDNPLPVTITSGATATSGANIVDSSGVAYSGSNPVPVTLVSGAGSTTGVQNLDGDGNYRGTFPIEGTVLVSDVTASLKAALIDSSGEQYSGSNPVPVAGVVSGTVIVSDVTNSIQSALIDSSGVQYSGSNPVPVGGTVLVSGVTNSLQSALIDSSGVQYSGSNPVPVAGTVAGTVTVSGVTDSLQSALIDSTGVQYSGSNPVPNTPYVVARTTNPTAVGDGNKVSQTSDDLGRTLTRPVQVRDLMQTAYATLTTGSGFGTETTLKASGSGKLLDLVYIMGTNDSDVATYIDLRQSTGGTVMGRIQIPAGGTAGVATPVPYPAPFADHTWTIDAPDITGTNVTVTALFSEEV